MTCAFGLVEKCYIPNKPKSWTQEHNTYFFPDKPPFNESNHAVDYKTTVPEWMNYKILSAVLHTQDIPII